MPRQPLGEVFGFPIDNLSAQAEHYRRNRLCPFNNKVPSCTKDKANDPLGVCSVNHDNRLVITCPVRFRQDWRIAVDAASFFFAPGTTWTSLVEIGITDGVGLAAGTIDVVLVSYDNQGRLTNFGALEVQAVYNQWCEWLTRTWDALMLSVSSRQYQGASHVYRGVYHRAV